MIDPTDIQAVKILEGEDMVTLITCHPYTQNKQRYVVYCRRINDQKNDSLVIPFDGEAYESSQPEIMLEKKLII